MNNDIEPRTTIRTRVSQTFEGIAHNVPEWPGFSHQGKPVVITRVTVSHRVTEDGISDPEVAVAARVVKKDGTLSVQDIETRFALTFAKGRALREELIAEYGTDVLVLAVQTSNKLYG